MDDIRDFSFFVVLCTYLSAISKGEVEDEREAKVDTGAESGWCMTPASDPTSRQPWKTQRMQVRKREACLC
jgi:hypothetical protein